MKCWDAVDPGFGDEEGQSISSFSISQKAKNAAALAYILKTVEPYYFEDIGECQTAREAWKILEDINTNISTLHVLMYLKELVTTQKGSDERMQDYLGRITATNRKCAKAGLTFGEKADAHFYLLGLPKEYEDLTRSLEREDRNMTPQLVRAKLLAEERRIERGTSPDSAAWEAHEARALRVQGEDHPQRHGRDGTTTQRWCRGVEPRADWRAERQQWRSHHQTRRGGKAAARNEIRPYGEPGGARPGGARPWQTSGRQRPLKCFTCGNLGHIANACPVNDGEYDSKAIQCYSCGDMGHPEKCCPSRLTVRVAPCRKMRTKSENLKPKLFCL